ncbi:MAG: hypothetical protein Q7S00_03695, partial [bacterium]|nr:hypothetical protein [bacterium]
MKKQILLLAIIFSFLGCQGNSLKEKSFKRHYSTDSDELHLTAQDFCLNADGTGNPERFVGGTPLAGGEGLCLVRPEEGFRTEAGSLEVVGLIRAADAELRGLDIFVRRDGASCSGPHDIESGCAQVTLEPTSDLDEEGVFEAEAPLPLSGGYEIRIQARFFFIRSGASRDVEAIRHVFREEAPSLSLELTGQDSSSPVNTIFFCETRDDNERTLSTVPCGDSSTAESLHTRRLKICVIANDGTCTAGDTSCRPDLSVFGKVHRGGSESAWTHEQAVVSNTPCGESGQGFLVDLPVGDGWNEIVLSAANAVTESDSSLAPEIKIRSFQNDLKGPELCVSYLKPDGRFIGFMDGRPISSAGLTDLIVDVAPGTCPSDPERVMPLAETTCLDGTAADLSHCVGDDPTTETIEGAGTLCLQKGNKSEIGTGGVFTQACPVPFSDHFQARLGRNNFSFPINTLTFKAFDEWGNKTEKTESFGFGQLNPFFETNGTPRFEQVDNALALFISDAFIEGSGESDLRAALEKILNSDEFKHSIFLKAFDPVQPLSDELSCRGNPSDPYDDTTVSEIKTFKLHPLSSGEEFPRVGHIAVPFIQILNDNRLWVTVRLDSLEARADSFVMGFEDTDGDGDYDLGSDIDDDGDGLCDDKDITEAADGSSCAPALSVDGEEVDDSYDDIRHKNYGTFLRGGRMDIASRRDAGGRRDLGDRCLGVNPIPLKLQLQHL